MPEKLKNYKQKKAAGYSYDQNGDSSNSQGAQLYASMPVPLIPIQSLTDIMALGGFNPNKYLSPQPMPFNLNFQHYGQVPPHMLHQQMPFYGNPQPFNGQMTNGQNQNGQRPQKQNNGQNDKKSDKKDKKKGEKKQLYVSKASPKKEETAEAK